MNKKIVYILGGNYAANGMSKIISQKINYLASNTNYELYAVLTERKDLPMHYPLDKRVKTVNFNINFDELDTMPICKKIYYYLQKQKKYKKQLTNFLLLLKADIVISAMRRDINFLNDIKDGSKKIGEIHFSKSNYREFNKKYLPKWLNEYITKKWRNVLIKEIKKLNSFIVLTHEDKEEWTEIQNIKVIPNFIKQLPKIKSSNNSKIIIASGRYTWQKGFDLLIHAWEFVNIKYPDWKLDIYGSGDNDVYQALVNKMNLNYCITCHPSTNNLYQKLVESSIYVLSSRYEGLPMVLLEASSCGLPIVSFACPCGPKDIIINGKNGYLVKPNNIKELADKICYLIENEDIRKEMGIQARRRAEDFTEDKIMHQWIDLFENRI